MKTGKVSEAILKRSVLRKLNIKNAEARYYGADAVTVETDTQISVTAAGNVPGFEADPAKSVLALANNLYAAGAVPHACTVHALLPETMEEQKLQEDMKKISAAADTYGMFIVGGHTQVTDQVLSAQYLLTGIGTAKKDQPVLKPGQALVLTKWIAIGGSAALARKYDEELRSRFPFSIVDAAQALEEKMSVREEAELILAFEEKHASHHQTAMHDLSQGGIFGALWEMAERSGVGLDVDLKKIPIRQETVEICELFDVNPYELYSAGALLVGTDSAEELAEELEKAGIPAAVIGYATDGNDRVIRNGEEFRHLDRPKQDAWYSNNLPELSPAASKKI